MNESVSRERGEGYTSVDGPKAVVEEILQRTYAMGATDNEKALFEAILEELRKGTCSRDEAIRRAHKILSEKERRSYH